MKINNIFSKKYEGVILAAGVHVTPDDFDMSTREFRRLVESLFDGGSEIIKVHLAELPEIRDYVEWADAQIEHAKQVWYEAHNIDDENAEDDMRSEEWWQRYCNSADWPSWEKYKE